MMHLLNFVLLALAAGNALAAPIEDQASVDAVDSAAIAASKIARHPGVMPTFRPLSADGSFNDKRSPQHRVNHGLPLPIVGVHPSPSGDKGIGSMPVAPLMGSDGHIGRKPAERQARPDNIDTASVEARDDIPDASLPRIGGVSVPPGAKRPAPKHSGESSTPHLPPGLHGPAPKHSGERSTPHLPPGLHGPAPKHPRDLGSSKSQLTPRFRTSERTPVGRSEGSDETYLDQ
ncbi:hypothetical protein BD413DRAFT_673067 [Trametes elegans]|nr:hypothetical protein BD413DRAFT_673067 [Trametes elegans]